MGREGERREVGDAKYLGEGRIQRLFHIDKLACRSLSPLLESNVELCSMVVTG